MCGIVYKHNIDGKPVNNDILQQFDKQRSRGTQGFGLFDGQEMNIFKSAKEDKILKWLVKYNSNLIMFHHRFPTSTINVKRAAHPMSTKKYFGNTQYILVHNGVIRNSKDLFAGHAKLDIDYQTMLADLTFNDSESLLWDFALTIEGKQERMKSKGDLAFICVKTVDGKLDTMYFGRNGRPLHLYRAKDTVELSSEGRGDDIKVQTLYTYKYNTNQLTKKPMAFTQPEDHSYYGNYHYSGTNYNRDNTSSYPNSGFHGNTGYESLLPYGAKEWISFEDRHEHEEWEGVKYEPDEDGFWRPVVTVPTAPVVKKDEPGSWLGDTLRKKFQKYFDSGQLKIGAGETAEAPVKLARAKRTPVYTIAEGGAISEQYLEDNLEAFEPESGAIQNKTMAELCKAEGNFEMAYWALETEYDDVLCMPEDSINIKRRLLLEACMSFIQNDPEYLSVDSISSIWSAVWAQQKLA
jgi:predicted glutamine amidotransferase